MRLALYIVAPSVGASRYKRAFSLVEVSIAIGVLSFSLMALIALFMVSVKANKESENAVAAANLATLIISQRRAMPVASGTSATMSNFALPNIDTASANLSSGAQPVYVASNGTKTTKQYADFGMLYKIEPVVSSSSAQIYMILYWPASAPQAGSSSHRYEISTLIQVP